MNLSELIKKELVGKYLIDSKFNEGEYAEWKGRKIKDAQLGLGEGREDAVLYLEFEGAPIYEDIYFYDNDTLILSDVKPEETEKEEG